jgi:natural product precursor
MKPNISNKKLFLNKATIAHLNEEQMKRLNGGGIKVFSYQTCHVTDDTCGSCHPETYCFTCPSLICPD